MKERKRRREIIEEEGTRRKGTQHTRRVVDPFDVLNPIECKVCEENVSFECLSVADIKNLRT
jgi:hypothetical protein